MIINKISHSAFSVIITFFHLLSKPFSSLEDVVYERKIRLYKNKIDSFKEIGDFESVDKYKKKLKTINQVYSDYCETNDLKRNYAREQGISLNIKNPKTISDVNTTLKEKIGFYDEDIGYTIIPKNAIITNVNIIAGKNTRSFFRKAEYYAEKYGGIPSEYLKMVGKVESDKFIFDIHFVKDSKGNEYDFKFKSKSRK